MNSCTDLLELNTHKLFKELKSSFSKSEKESRNILEVRDDILYVWNADKCCVFTLNVAAIRSQRSTDIPYQVSDLIKFIF